MFSDALEEIERNMQALAAETKCNHFIMGGDWNTELWAQDSPTERAQTGRAQKIWEFLEGVARADPQHKPQRVDKLWTRIARDGKKNHIDSWHLTPEWKDLGVVENWHVRSDHTPIFAEIPLKSGKVIKFSDRPPSAMKGWLPPSASATARPARRWASMNVKSIAEVQEEVNAAAKCEMGGCSLSARRCGRGARAQGQCGEARQDSTV